MVMRSCACSLALKYIFLGKSPYTPKRAVVYGNVFHFPPTRNLVFYVSAIPITVFDRF